MANSKYELLENDFIFFRDKKLFRIKALKDIGESVKVGYFGGYIESEANLSANGNCWVFYEAMVFGGARIRENVHITSSVSISGYGSISGDGSLYGDDYVYSDFYTSGDVRISGNIRVFRNA